MRMTPKWQTYSNLMPICFCSQIRLCSGRPQVRYPNSMGTQVRACTRDRDGHQVFRSFGPMWGDYPLWGGVIGKPEGTPPCFTGALNKRHTHVKIATQGTADHVKWSTHKIGVVFLLPLKSTPTGHLRLWKLTIGGFWKTLRKPAVQDP